MKDTVAQLTQSEESSRKEFLINMYNQMFADINRQLGVTWQAVSVVIGTFAVFALLEKQIITLDIAIGLVILVNTWSMAHLHETGYWYNRNLCIIANIERQFLVTEDLKNIQYYFGAHRKANKMIKQLRIHMVFNIALICVCCLYHFFKQVLPGLNESFVNFEAQRTIPYILAALLFFYMRSLKKEYQEKYTEFITQSPGVTVNIQNTAYGVGHGQ